LGEFLEAEWERQTQFRLASNNISDKADGEYRKRPRSFCLLVLYPGAVIGGAGQ